MMITEQHIKSLLESGEHQTLEMKKCRNSVPESVHEVWLILPLPKSHNRNVGEDVGDISGREITERQKEIIKILKESPTASAKKMSVTLSVTSRTIERDIAFLKTMGILIRKGTDNDGEWIIKQ